MDARRIGARSPDRAWARRRAVALGPASLRFRLERGGRGDWPRPAGAEAHALAPLLALSVLAALYLVVIGLAGTTVGVLLWPAAAAHAVLAILLARAWMKACAAE